MELKRLGRKELLEMLIEQARENERLRSELKLAEKRLKSREIVVDRAGSMAEAALALNRVYESVDNAARQYLENIKRWHDAQQTEYNRIIAEAEAKAEEIIANAGAGIHTAPVEQPKPSTTSWEDTLKEFEDFDWFSDIK